MLNPYAQTRDDVYVSGAIVRQDYSFGISAAKPLLDELHARFPEYGPFGSSRHNLIGSFDGYREPYANQSISWYNCLTRLSEQLQLAFGTSYQTSRLKNWYGLKFDLVTNAVLLKVVLNDYLDDKPAFPVEDCFFAVTHAQDGTSSEWIDAYFKATPERVAEFCTENGLQYPLPAAAETGCDEIIFWGVVFNKHTLQFGPVKGYARYIEPSSMW